MSTKPIANDNGNNTDTVSSDGTSRYEPGLATELLSQSVQKLQITDNKSSDFRIQASKILTAMLEARLNEHNNKVVKDKDGSNANSNYLSGKILFEQSSKIAASAKIADPCVNNNDNNKTIKSTFGFAVTDSQSDINANNANTLNSDLPLPPPPPPFPLPSIPSIDCPLPPPPPLTAIEPTPKRILKPENGSTNVVDEGDEIVSVINDGCNVDENSNKNDNVDGISANLSPQQNGYNNVIFRNKNTKPELTSHARDRRSYIGDNYRNNNYNNLVTSHTTEIASGLKDGKHPICSVCHVKISR